MEKTGVEDVAHPTTVSPAAVLKPLSPALGATGVALNYFELAPGEQFGYDYHRHRDQEEVFYVVAGVVTFETESGAVPVGAGEVVRFAPGEWQLGRNRGDERVVALAVGAPRDSEAIDYRRDCPDCGAETVQTPAVVGDREAVVLTCETCGTETDRVAL